jgi:hypothetical protein
MTTGMGIMEKGSFSVASKFPTPAIDKRSKKKNRVSVTDGQNGEQLREVSRILLVGTTMGHSSMLCLPRNLQGTPTAG